MRSLFLLFTAALTIISSSALADTNKASKPNIVIFVADDLGYGDLGYHGSEIKTPNLDTLANAGVKLEDFYAQPVCTQSRAALLTGRYPHRYGLERRVIKPDDTHGLPKSEITLPEILKEAGYRTAIVGKWHLGHAKKEFLPLARGFDIQYGPLKGQVDYFKHGYQGQHDWYRNGIPVKEEGYATDLLATEAVRVIESNPSSQPLFLYLAFTAPHAPVEAPEEAISEYRTIENLNRRVFAAAVTKLDSAVGKVIEALKKSRLEDNTIMVFVSDNGGSLDAGANNSPYSGDKRSFGEGGIRVPAFINFKGGLPQGKRIEAPLHLVDLLPTLLSATGISATGISRQNEKPLDGLDLWSLLKTDAPLNRQALLATKTYQGAVLRQGPWKLIHNYSPESYELYNIAEDPKEQRNLAETNSAKLSQLRLELKHWS